MSDFAKITISRELPPAGHYTDRGVELLKSMCGARIIDIGAADGDSISIEGGGFVIDFVADGSIRPRRVVFGFNERGMWIEYEGHISPPSL